MCPTNPNTHNSQFFLFFEVTQLLFTITLALYTTQTHIILHSIVMDVDVFSTSLSLPVYTNVSDVNI